MDVTGYPKASNYIVTPVAIETFGPWAPMGLKLIKEVGKKICELTGEKRSTSYLFQSISIAIQRGNAASVMETVLLQYAQSFVKLLYVALRSVFTSI